MAVKSHSNENITKDLKFKLQFDLIITGKAEYYDYKCIVQ